MNLLLFSTSLYWESENSGLHGLEYWTVREGHNNPAGFIFRVMEPKFKFFGFMGRVSMKSCERQQFSRPLKFKHTPML